MLSELVGRHDLYGGDLLAWAERQADLSRASPQVSVGGRVDWPDFIAEVLDARLSEPCACARWRGESLD